MTRLVGCLLASGSSLPSSESRARPRTREGGLEKRLLDVQMESRSGKLKEGAYNTSANLDYYYCFNLSV